MSEPERRDDDASLYVLGLLDEQERQAFEARLATQPALLDEVRALEANLEGLALAAPPRTPPPRVWAGIVERTSRPDRPATSLFARLLQALRTGWAVAGLLALAWLVQELAGSRERVPASAGEPSASSRPATQASRPKDWQPQGVPRERSPGTPTPTIAGDGTPAIPGAEERHLQARVQMLTEQLATLTRALVERPVPPPGSAQLQLFRLVGTNHSAEPQKDGGIEVLRATPGETDGRLQLALVLAAARQFAAQPSSPSTSTSETAPSPPASPAATPTATPNSPGSGSTTDSTPTASADASTPTDPTPAIDAAMNTAATTPTTVEAVPPDPEPIQIVDLTTSSHELPPQSAASHISTNATSTLTMAGGSTAFGAYSLETGFGAIAFRTLPNPLEGVYQLWVANGSSGITYSVGFVQSKSPVVVMNFQTSLTSSIQPVFFITAEPVGGSLIPTGPIVALPPSSTPNP